MTSVRLIVVTANIGRGVGPREAANNIRRVVHGFVRWLIGILWRRIPVLIGWQEIDEADEPDEHGILHRVLAAQMPGAEIVGNQSAVPITIPEGWRIVRARTDRTCDGKPHASPPRVAVQALIEHEKTGLRLVVINGHYPLPRLTGWRLWQNCHASWIFIVERWLDQGYTVAATRDRNKRGSEDPLSPFERELLPQASIDRITVIQAAPGPHAVQIHAGKPRTVQLTIDGHDAHGVPLLITPLTGI